VRCVSVAAVVGVAGACCVDLTTAVCLLLVTAGRGRGTAVCADMCAQSCEQTGRRRRGSGSPP
jgi:hypothetical protein